jgi:hypothetical protein
VAELDREALLARFSRGALSDAERRALYEAALEDQELFDALTEEDALRMLLDHPEARPAVLQRLTPSALRPTAARKAFRIPLAIAASLAAVALGTFTLWRVQPKDMLETSRDVPEAAAVWSESEAVAKGLTPPALRATLAAGSLGPGRFRTREAMRLELIASAEARLVVLVHPASGGSRLLVPPADAALPAVGPNAPLVLGPDAGLRAPSVPGHYQLRLVAARLEASADLAALRQRLTAGEAAVVDVDFDVAR